MPEGELWLDFNNGEEEEHWEARVTHATLLNNEIVIEFSGRDPDLGGFSGSFKAKRVGARYVGGGLFTVKGATTTAVVSLTLKVTDGGIGIEGTWLDSGDSEPFDLTAELERLNDNSHKRARE